MGLFSSNSRKLIKLHNAIRTTQKFLGAKGQAMIFHKVRPSLEAIVRAQVLMHDIEQLNFLVGVRAWRVSVIINGKTVQSFGFRLETVEGLREAIGRYKEVPRKAIVFEDCIGNDIDNGNGNENGIGNGIDIGNDIGNDVKMCAIDGRSLGDVTPEDENCSKCRDIVNYKENKAFNLGKNNTAMDGLDSGHILQLKGKYTQCSGSIKNSDTCGLNIPQGSGAINPNDNLHYTIIDIADNLQPNANDTSLHIEKGKARTQSILDRIKQREALRRAEFISKTSQSDYVRDLKPLVDQLFDLEHRKFIPFHKIVKRLNIVRGDENLRTLCERYGGVYEIRRFMGEECVFRK